MGNALASTHDANVEAVDHNGWTALMLAAQKGHTDTVNALAGTHNANVGPVPGPLTLFHVGQTIAFFSLLFSDGAEKQIFPYYGYMIHG